MLIQGLVRVRTADQNEVERFAQQGFTERLVTIEVIASDRNSLRPICLGVSRQERVLPLRSHNPACRVHLAAR